MTGSEPTPSARRTVRVHFSDACSDVLTWLAGQPSDTWWTWHGIRDAVAPADAADSGATVQNALRTLREAGLVEVASAEGIPGWRITDEGRATLAVAEPTPSAPREFPCLPSLGEHCGQCHRCTDPAPSAPVETEPTADYAERCKLTRFLDDLDWDLSDRADVQEWMQQRLDALGGPVSIEEAWEGA